MPDNMQKRHKEAIVYLCLWVIVISLYLVDEFRHRADLNLPMVDLRLFSGMLASLGPFVVLFLINNYLLIPKFLLKNKIGKYTATVFATLCVLIAFQVVFSNDINDRKPPREESVMRSINHKFGMRKPPKRINHHKPPKPPKPFSALPFIFDLTYGLLIIGGNAAIALVFQRYDDRLEKEKLMKANAESRLIYLKAQINPHFYMNMLNNIHGMIEIDPEKAQSMVIDMSRLMGYMLYESSKPLIFLDREVKFLTNYIELMRLRFDREKVGISYKFPDEEESAGVKVPPLLFLAFIENAFKHGISYQKESFISVSIELSGKRLIFNCANRKFPATGNEKSGVGLNNIRQRLSLLYGDAAHLHIDEESETFKVTLSIPYDEN